MLILIRLIVVFYKMYLLATLNSFLCYQHIIVVDCIIAHIISYFSVLFSLTDIQWPPYPYYITDILLSSTNAPRKNFNPHTIPDGGYYSTLPMFTTTHMFYEKEDLEEVITYRQESYYRYSLAFHRTQ